MQPNQPSSSSSAGLRSSLRSTALMLAVAACTGVPEGEPGDPACDGRLQQEEGTLDAPFDRDNDGYVDGRNDACVATYGPWVLDCDDTDPRMHPEAMEIACNGIDDDCNSDTPDALDHDADGSIACDDCDDADAARSPTNREYCWDGIDNDCDGVVDPGCGLNYNGEYALDRQITYKCSISPGPIEIFAMDFDSVSVLWSPPIAALVSDGSALPGSLDGEIGEDGSFVVEGSTPVATGGCTAYFRWTGSFTGSETFTTDFEIQVDGNLCKNCDDKVWTSVVGTRSGY